MKTDFQKMTKAELMAEITAAANFPNGLMVAAFDYDEADHVTRPMLLTKWWEWVERSNHASTFRGTDYDKLVTALTAHLSLVDGLCFKIIDAHTGNIFWESGKDGNYFFRESKFFDKIPCLQGMNKVQLIAALELCQRGFYVMAGNDPETLKYLRETPFDGREYVEDKESATIYADECFDEFVTYTTGLYAQIDEVYWKIVDARTGKTRWELGLSKHEDDKFQDYGSDE